MPRQMISDVDLERAIRNDEARLRELVAMREFMTEHPSSPICMACQAVVSGVLCEVHLRPGRAGRYLIREQEANIMDLRESINRRKSHRRYRQSKGQWTLAEKEVV